MNNKSALIPNPCPESWDRLKPEDRGHFCESCQTKVWDLSSMTEAEAEALLRERTGDLCVSYRERGDGEIAYRSSTPVVPANRLMRRLPVAAGLSFALAACTPTTGGADKQPHVDEDKPAAAEPEAVPAKPVTSDGDVITQEPGENEGGHGERIWKGKTSSHQDEFEAKPETEAETEAEPEATPPEPEAEPKKGKVAPLIKKGKVADPF